MHCGMQLVPHQHAFMSPILQCRYDCQATPPTLVCCCCCYRRHCCCCCCCVESPLTHAVCRWLRHPAVPGGVPHPHPGGWRAGHTDRQHGTALQQQQQQQQQQEKKKNAAAPGHVRPGHIRTLIQTCHMANPQPCAGALVPPALVI